MQDEIKNGGGMQDDRNFNSGMQDNNALAGVGLKFILTGGMRDTVNCCL